MTEEKKDVKVPEKFKKLVEEIEKMTVLDLSELVKILEEKFGVSAAIAAAPAISGGADAEIVKEEKTAFNLELKSAGDQKIQVVKVVKDLTGLGLKEAKDMVDKAPKIIKENIKKEDAEEMKAKLEAVGATVEIK